MPKIPTTSIKADPADSHGDGDVDATTSHATSSSSSSEPYVKPEPSTPRSTTKVKPEPHTPRSATPANATPSTSPSKKSPSKLTPWSDRERLCMINALVNDAKLDWNALAEETGRSVTQLRDQWRKVLLPNIRASFGGDAKGNYVGN